MGCGRSSAAAAGEPAPKPSPASEPASTPASEASKPTEVPAPQPHKPTAAQPPPQFAERSSGSGAGGEAAEAGGDTADDFAWVSAKLDGPSDLPPAWAASAVRSAAASSSSAAASSDAAEVTASSLEVKVQVLLEGGWRDSSAEETLQICEHIAKGERQFQIKARGQMYDIVLDGPDGCAYQVNNKTGKRRSIRVMDADTSPEEASGPERGSSMKDVKATSPEVLQQQEWGAQSKRGGASQHPMTTLKDNTHAQDCFALFAKNEEKLCGEWAVFYHSYSFAALLYEVHAAVGAVLFRFRSQFATLPRILVHEFQSMFPNGPDAKILMNLFDTKYAANKRDHHPEFRAVGLSVMCSLVATGPEACVPMVFIAGYSCKDLSFRGVLENVLESCYVPKAKVKKLADEIIALSETHGLDVSQFGGKPCKSGMAGHLLQIFMKRNLVDTLCYPAKPYGVIDNDRLPLSDFINKNKSVQVGQARIIAHPKYFMQANQIRCYVASADQTFHKNRAAFQEKLTGLLNVILGEPSLRLKAATGIYGGKLPAWWSDQDQRAVDKARTSQASTG